MRKREKPSGITSTPLVPAIAAAVAAAAGRCSPRCLPPGQPEAPPAWLASRSHLKNLQMVANLSHMKQSTQKAVMAAQAAAGCAGWGRQAGTKAGRIGPGCAQTAAMAAQAVTLAQTPALLGLALKGGAGEGGGSPMPACRPPACHSRACRTQGTGVSMGGHCRAQHDGGRRCAALAGLRWAVLRCAHPSRWCRTAGRTACTAARCGAWQCC